MWAAARGVEPRSSLTACPPIALHCSDTPHHRAPRGHQRPAVGRDHRRTLPGGEFCGAKTLNLRVSRIALFSLLLSGVPFTPEALLGPLQRGCTLVHRMSPSASTPLALLARRPTTVSPERRGLSARWESRPALDWVPLEREVAHHQPIHLSRLLARFQGRSSARRAVARRMSSSRIRATA